jgi:diguanylate cyclase (GGDEF)-like protein
LVLWLIIRHSLDLDDTVLAHQKMVHLATHDLLTSLPNRTLFADRFDQAIHHWQRSGNQFALLLIDLDFFKEINDRYGHEIGDHVLIACANRMSSQLRACDTVARYGGDEFVILLDNLLNFEDAQGVGEKILAAISEPIESPVGSLSLSCSIGVAICPIHGTSLDVLRKAADQAMYRAKEQGRNALAICPVQIG